MERINQFSFFEMGKELQRLSAVFGTQNVEVGAQEAMAPLFAARTTLQELLKGNPIPVSVSRQCADRLLNTIQSLIDRTYYEEKDGKRTFKAVSDTEKIVVWFYDVGSEL